MSISFSNLYTYLIGILLILFGTDSVSHTKNHPRNPIIEINYQVSPNFVPEFDSIVEIGLCLNYQNGKRRKTRGLNKGTKSWSKFDVNINHGRFDNGKIHIDRKSVLKSKEKVVIVTVSPKKQKDFKKQLFIGIPYLKRIALEYDSGAILAPGFEIPFWIRADYSSGKSFYSKNKAQELNKNIPKNIHVNINDFAIDSPEPLIISQQNVILPINDSLLYRSINLSAVHKKNKKLYTELRIPINYKAKYYLNYQGFAGAQGYNGNNGYDRDVGDGSDGENGGDGENGSDGIDLKIYAIDNYFFNSDTLVHLAFESENGIETLILDANKANVTIQANGGNGGNGGHGGSGGNGGDETNEYESGWGGNGGDGGNGGNGGNGSHVKIFTSLDMFFDSRLIIVENSGGAAGIGGKGGARGIGGSEMEEENDDTPFVLSLLKTVAEVILPPNSGAKGKDGQPGKKGKNGKVFIIEK